MINTAQFMATPNHSDMPQMSSPINNLGAAGHEGKPQIVIQPDPDLLNQLEEEKKEKDKIQSELKANEQALVNEQDQKKKMEALLAQMEQKLVRGGDALAVKEKEQAQKYRKF